MITAQDIREKTFTKQFNGYSMNQVDEFLDEISADISAMAKENQALTAKMRVLLEKLEEYRQTEDSMRRAILSAQETGSRIEKDAQKKADAIIAQAHDSAERITRQATQGLAGEEAKLEAAKKNAARFIEHMQLVLEKQLAFYDKLSDATLTGRPQAVSEQPAPRPVREPAADAPVKSVEAPAQKSAEEAPQEAPAEETGVPAEEEEPTRRFREEPKKKKRTFDDFRFEDDV